MCHGERRKEGSVMNKMIIFDLLCFGPLVLWLLTGYVDKWTMPPKHWVTILAMIGLFINGIKLALGN